jgi:modulator of drug activity B
MKNVLILNGHQYYDPVAKGELTQSVITATQHFLEKHGFDVRVTHMEKEGYTPVQEVEKFKWADAFILQYPIYWMGVPWLMKKYIDEVFSAGAHNGIYESDGRSRKDPSRRYGSGGLMQEKRYMLSLTYNCPASEFSNPDGFFDGMSVDEANVATHKTWQFCGATPMETFSLHDIFKGDLDLNAQLVKLEQVLNNNFLSTT